MEITSQIESLKISSDDNLVNAYGLLKQVKAMKKETKKSQDSIVKEAKKPYDKALQERKETMKPSVHLWKRRRTMSASRPFSRISAGRISAM